jgi:hypothetical protein
MKNKEEQQQHKVSINNTMPTIATQSKQQQCKVHNEQQQPR